LGARRKRDPGLLIFDTFGTKRAIGLADMTRLAPKVPFEGKKVPDEGRGRQQVVASTA
jgi:hypothetical protein